MNDTASKIRVGMDVHSREGEKIGCVAVIWPHIPVSPEGAPPQPWEPVENPDTTGFFQVDRGGVLGLAATH